MIFCAFRANVYYVCLFNVVMDNQVNRTLALVVVAFRYTAELKPIPLKDFPNVEPKLLINKLSKIELKFLASERSVASQLRS